MPSTLAQVTAIVLLFLPTRATAEPQPVAATIETTLVTAQGQIRQFAFDGDATTYFKSSKNAGRADHFTLVFDKPVTCKSIMATTGQPDGANGLDAGALEVSVDGKRFTPLAKFEVGQAHAKLDGKRIVAVRIRPAQDLEHPLAIREFVIESLPAVATFKYPIEFVVDVSDAPEMKAWAEKAAAICQRQYAMINEELKSEGFKPPTVISLTLQNDYDGVAAASGNKIKGSVKFFKNHPDDFGAMVHETVHCVQLYRTRNNPGWLVEGIADYVRFFKFEPDKLGRIAVDRARYDGSYRITAAFLAYVAQKYDKQLVLKLNKALREGEYKEEIWKALTKKTVQQLGDEWKQSLRK
jgi:hypothetical protein